MGEEIRVPDLGGDPANLTPIYNFMNDSASFHERSNLEQSLNAWNFDDGFIDIYWDSSKISSTTKVNVNTGTNGYVERQASTQFLEGLNTGTGSYSNPYTFDLTANTKGYLSAVKAYVTSGSNFEVTITDSNNNTIATASRGTSVNSVYTLNIPITAYSRLIDENETVTVEITGSNSDEIVGNGGQNISGTHFSVNGRVPADYNNNIQGVEYSEATTETGTIVQDAANLDVVPSKVVAELEYELNGGSIELVLSDGNGNNATLKPEDFEKEISVGFESSNITATINLTGTGTEKPRILENKFIGVQ